MKSKKQTGSEAVTQFLAELEHPMKAEIEQLRQLILGANAGLSEHIKWNAPSFCADGDDRITMRIHPPPQLQLIFHRGAKVRGMPAEKLISDSSGMLSWKTNDRAVASFSGKREIGARAGELVEIINRWVGAAV